MKLFIKTAIALATALPLSSIAQTQLGIRAGGTRSYTDVTPNQSNYAFGLNASQKLNPWLSVTLEGQLGKLSAGDLADPTLFHYTNTFLQADLSIKLFPLCALEASPSLYYFRGIYGSFGLGLMHNNAKTKLFFHTGFNNIADRKATDMLLPCELGFDIPLAKINQSARWHFNVAYRYNFLFNDKMDGHDVFISSNKNNDGYSAVLLGLKYTLSPSKIREKHEVSNLD